MASDPHTSPSPPYPSKAPTQISVPQNPMDPPPAPPHSTTVTDPLPPLPTANNKLRLMCSYGGHIVPRPQSKSLFYAGGETRIVALDRRTTAASLSTLVTHLSRTLFNNRPFHLKYQLPNEDLDSLISVTTDEDLQNMLEEHDRVSAIASAAPSRIRLFLFPVKPESLGSALLDPKAESWFSDALKNTRIVQRGQSADSGLGGDLLALNIGGGSDSNVTLEAQVESSSNSTAAATGGGSSIGGESKEAGGVPESLVLETSSSFGSTSSSISMSNLPVIGVQCEDGGLGLLEKKIRVPSSASIESDYSIGSASNQPRTGIYHEPLIQVASGVSSYTVELESSVSDPPSAVHMQKAVQLSGYQLSQHSDGKQPQYELQYIQGGAPYMPQYGMPLSSYYPMYQVPVQQQQPQSPYLLNQPYPIYLVPVRPNQNYSMQAQCSLIDNANIATSRPPLHPQTAIVQPPMAYKEVITAHQVPESATKAYQTVSAGISIVGAPSTQVKQQLMEPPELHQPSQPVTAASVATNNCANELGEDLAYTQIYKTQPPAPALTSQCQTTMKGVAVMLSDTMQLQSNIKHQTALHPQ